MDRSSSDPSRVMDSVARAAQATPDLELLLLFGSRARGDDQPRSDWDFGYLATDALDVVFDRAVLAERTMAVERHLRRVSERLPVSAAEMPPASDASDAVILHLWQATQIVIAYLATKARKHEKCTGSVSCVRGRSL